VTLRLETTFARLRARNEAALVTFITAGDPAEGGTPALVAALGRAGADIVELGIPYSDPLADGPSIQASSQRALERGVTPASVLGMVRAARKQSDVPLVLMTSYNLVLRYGLARFAEDAAEAGADGAILTDLPPEEAGAWKTQADANNLATVFLVTPVSTEARLQLIAAHATGFVYCVSRTGVTGGRKELPPELVEYLARVRAATAKPLCVGFGISTPEQVAQVAGLADGVVIGATLVDFLHGAADNPKQAQELATLVGAWKRATRRDKP